MFGCNFAVFRARRCCSKATLVAWRQDVQFSSIPGGGTVERLMPYSAAQLEQLADAYREWTDRRDALATAILTRAYATERAKEFATHGLSRRIGMLQHCLDRVFECVPPEAEQPTRYELMDATAFVQSFVINVYGAIDNLAHIWCLDAAIVDPRGRPLAPGRIGLTPKNEFVRGSLPAALQAYLANHDEWFGYLESYRHALGHRIPLYIPPRQLDPPAQAEFYDLDQQRSEAIRRHDWERVDTLQSALDRVGVFEPYIMHSFGEQAQPMRFHAQLVCDLATVVEIAERVLDALEWRAAHGGQPEEPA